MKNILKLILKKKDKIDIFLISLPIIFALIFFVFSKNFNTNKYYSEIWITKTTPAFVGYFEKFKDIDLVDFKSNKTVDEPEKKNEFNFVFFSKLTSSYNMKKFIKNYNKQFISKKNAKLINDSFANFFYSTDAFNLKNALTLDYYRLEIEHLNDIDGSILLNDYVKYTTKEVIFHLIEFSELNTMENIDIVEGYLKVVNDRKESTFSSKSAVNQYSDIKFNRDYLIQSLKIYEQNLFSLREFKRDQIFFQKKILGHTSLDKDKNKIKYDDLFEWNSISKLESRVLKPKHLKFLIQGFILGLVIAFSIFYIKNILRKY